MNKMKIVVRGIRDEVVKDELKAIIREYCECDRVYTKGYYSGTMQSGHLRGLEIYLTGSNSLVGRILYDTASGKPKSYTVVKRRRVVKVYALKYGHKPAIKCRV